LEITVATYLPPTTTSLQHPPRPESSSSLCCQLTLDARERSSKVHQSLAPQSESRRRPKSKATKSRHHAAAARLNLCCCPLKHLFPTPKRSPSPSQQQRPGFPDFTRALLPAARASLPTSPTNNALPSSSTLYQPSTLLLAHSTDLTSTDFRDCLGLPVMVGIFRRLYDWLLSLFWYVSLLPASVDVSSSSCRAAWSCARFGCRLRFGRASCPVLRSRELATCPREC
jgi:hypothetical protein